MIFQVSNNSSYTNITKFWVNYMKTIGLNLQRIQIFDKSFKLAENFGRIHEDLILKLLHLINGNVSLLTQYAIHKVY